MGTSKLLGDGGNTPSVCVDCCDYTWRLSHSGRYHKSMNYISRDLTLINWFKKKVLCYKQC